MVRTSSLAKRLLTNFYVQVALFFTLLACSASFFFIIVQSNYLAKIVKEEYLEHNRAIIELIATESQTHLDNHDDYALFLYLRKFAQMPDIISIELYNPEGKLIKGIKNTLSGRQIISSGVRLELPDPGYTLTDDVLTLWQPLGSAVQGIGMVNLQADISSVSGFRLQLMQRSSFISVIGLSLSLLVMALFFYRPLSSLEKASQFATDFIKKPGKSLKLPPLPLQFERLKTSLNQASLQLERLEHEKANTLASLNVVLDHSVDGILLIDETLRVRFFNKAAERIFGYKANEMIGQSVQKLTPIPLTLEMHRQNLRNALLKGQRKNGELFYMEISDNETEFEGERVFIAFIRDVTQTILERRAHREIEENNRKLAVIANKSSHAVSIVKADGSHEWINDSFTQLTGYSLEEIQGKKAAEFLFHSESNNQRFEVERAQSFKEEQVIYTKSNEAIYVIAEGQPILNEQGECVNYVLLLFDITKERQIKANLLKAKYLAEEASEAKSQFLSRVSHEFRTPLNAILGFSQLLELGQLEPLQKSHLTQISQAGKHLLSLVNDVLDIAQIEAGKLSLSIETLSLSDVLEEALQLTKHLAQKNQVATLVRHADTKNSEPFYVKADKQRLKQVLINLLSNAYKYNKVQGTVTISSQKHQGGLELRIKDSGIGIAEHRLKDLFTPFNRLGAEQTAVEGTGIGLSLSKELVKLLGGRLEISSQEGEGTEVLLTLPVAEKHQLNPQLPQVINLPASKGNSLVYLEDNLINLKLIEHVLEHLPGTSLKSSMRGDTGLELIQNQLPDLVLLDLHLPGLSGREVLKALKANPKTAAIPVIILSADASTESKQSLRELGAVHYLTKPINLPELMTCIHTYSGPRVALTN